MLYEQQVLQNGAWSSLNMRGPAHQLTSLYLDHKPGPACSICPRFKGLWKSGTGIGAEKPAALELKCDFLAMFSKQPKTSQAEAFPLLPPGPGAGVVHWGPLLSTAVTSLPLTTFQAVFFFPPSHHSNVKGISLKQCIGHCNTGGGGQ